MVETSVKPHRRHARRWRPALLALLAVGFLLAMVLTGKLPETRQLVKFEPGVCLPCHRSRSAASTCTLASTP